MSTSALDEDHDRFYTELESAARDPGIAPPVNRSTKSSKLKTRLLNNDIAAAAKADAKMLLSKGGRRRSSDYDASPPSLLSLMVLPRCSRRCDFIADFAFRLWVDCCADETLEQCERLVKISKTFRTETKALLRMMPKRADFVCEKLDRNIIAGIKSCAAEIRVKISLERRVGTNSRFRSFLKSKLNKYEGKGGVLLSSSLSSLSEKAVRRRRGRRVRKIGGQGDDEKEEEGGGEGGRHFPDVGLISHSSNTSSSLATSSTSTSSSDGRDSAAGVLLSLSDPKINSLNNNKKQKQQQQQQKHKQNDLRLNNFSSGTESARHLFVLRKGLKASKRCSIENPSPRNPLRTMRTQCQNPKWRQRDLKSVRSVRASTKQQNPESATDGTRDESLCSSRPSSSLVATTDNTSADKDSGELPMVRPKPNILNLDREE